MSSMSEQYAQFQMDGYDPDLDRPEPAAQQQPCPLPTYRQHMTSTMPGDRSNYRIICSCGWEMNLASFRDEQAAAHALLHVRTATGPLSAEALFDRL